MSVGYIDASAELQEEEPTIWVTCLQPALDSQQSLQNQSSEPVRLSVAASFPPVPSPDPRLRLCPARTFEEDLKPAWKLDSGFGARLSPGSAPTLTRSRSMRVAGNVVAPKLRLWTGNQSATSQLLKTKIRKNGFSTEVAEEEEKKNPRPVCHGVKQSWWVCGFFLLVRWQ